MWQKMNCPHCNKPMQIMYCPEATIINDEETVEVLGRCDDCDIDATWVIDTLFDGTVLEHSLKQYFFG